MVELTPSRWLLLAGIFGLVTPWAMHWYDKFELLDAFPSIYVVATWASLIASLIAACGGLWQMSRLRAYSSQQMELVWAFICGSLGLGSLFLVVFMSMM